MSMTKVSDDFDKTLDALFTADEERQRQEKKQAGEARIVRQKSVGEFLSFREKVIRPLLEKATRGLKQRDRVCVIEESNDEQPAITLSIPAEKSSLTFRAGHTALVTLRGTLAPGPLSQLLGKPHDEQSVTDAILIFVKAVLQLP
jgi:hypothetical protein